MWTGSIPEPPSCLEIGIKLPKSNSNKITAIKIWNYNKSLLDSVKGVKEVEILI